MQTLVIAGTGIPGPLAHRFYGPLARSMPNGSVISLPVMGFGGLQSCYEHVVESLKKLFIGKDPVIVIGHSQGALLAAHLAYDYPGRVQLAIFLSGPFHGARLAELSKFTPAASDMSPGSYYLAALHSKHIDYMAAGYGSRLHSIWAAPTHRMVPGDGVISPTRSSYLAGIKNYIVVPAHRHAALSAKVPKDVVLVDGSTDHFHELNDRHVLNIISNITHAPAMAA